MVHYLQEFSQKENKIWEKRTIARGRALSKDKGVLKTQSRYWLFVRAKTVTKEKVGYTGNMQVDGRRESEVPAIALVVLEKQEEKSNQGKEWGRRYQRFGKKRNIK